MPKRNILFVDDEPIILHGIKRSVEDYLDGWNVYFSTTGMDALALMAMQPFDVIISDLVMPGMDGNQLLEAVSERYPSTIRFILTGKTGSPSAVLSSRLAHQFIPKPFDIKKLHESVERTCRLRDLLSDPDLMRIITGIRILPSLPTLYITLMKELESKEPTPSVVGDIIGRDVAMTAKILQLVNSAFFGLPGKVSSPQKAVAILGLNTIKALVLNIHIFSAYQGYASPAFSIDRLWQHSILVGNLSRSIAMSAHLDTTMQGNAQIGGMLHDVGKLLELNIPGFFQKVKFTDGTVAYRSEYQEIKTSHAEIGAYLLGIWGLPQSIVEGVGLHHRPNHEVASDFNVVTAMHIANGLHHMELNQYKGSYDVYLDMDYLNRVGVVNRLDEWADMAKRIFHP